jgi:hypothetical protein
VNAEVKLFQVFPVCMAKRLAHCLVIWPYPGSWAQSRVPGDPDPLSGRQKFVVPCPFPDCMEATLMLSFNDQRCHPSRVVSDAARATEFTWADTSRITLDGYRDVCNISI